MRDVEGQNGHWQMCEWWHPNCHEDSGQWIVSVLAFLGRCLSYTGCIARTRLCNVQSGTNRFLPQKCGPSIPICRGQYVRAGINGTTPVGRGGQCVMLPDGGRSEEDEAGDRGSLLIR